MDVMTPTEAHQWIKATPFRPIRIHTGAGDTYEVRDSAFAFVTRRSVLLGEDYDDGGWPTSCRYVNLDRITRIEPRSDIR